VPQQPSRQREAIFTATARAVRTAVEIDPRTTGVPRIKGTLTG